jgi:hypothetical protein
MPSAAITHLQNGTGLSVVKIWLAGLLGGLETQPSGEYSASNLTLQPFYLMHQLSV